MPTTLLLVRHATPDWSRTDIPYFTPPGPELIETGKAEARELGEYLKGQNVAEMFHSPLVRCVQTAAISGEIAGLTPVESTALTEWQPGEKDADIKGRLAPVWDYLTTQPNTVALVTHGGPISVMLTELGMDKDVLAQYKRIFDRNNALPPAGVWCATRANAHWELRLAFTPVAYRDKLKA